MNVPMEAFISIKLFVKLTLKSVTHHTQDTAHQHTPFNRHTEIQLKTICFPHPEMNSVWIPKKTKIFRKSLNLNANAIFVKLGIKTQVLGQLITIASVSGQLSMLYLYTANLFITQLEPSVMATK